MKLVVPNAPGRPHAVSVSVAKIKKCRTSVPSERNAAPKKSLQTSEMPGEARLRC
jgi:hypothetical protein